MRKGLLALEGMEAAIARRDVDAVAERQTDEVFATAASNETPVELEVVPEAIVELDSGEADIAQRCDELEEGERIADSVERIATRVEDSVERGEGLNETAADLANTAMEGYYDRLGYTRAAGKKTVSMEGLDRVSTRLSNSQEALKDIKQFQSKLGHHLAIAQEDMLESVSNHLGNSFAALPKAIQLIQTASKEFDANGPTEDMVDGGKWSVPFGFFAEDMVPGSVVIARLKKMSAAIMKVGPSEVVRETIGVVNDIAVELNKDKPSKVSSGDTLGRKLEELHKGAAAVQSILVADKAKDSGTTHFAPLTKEEKDALVALSKDLAREVVALSAHWKKLEEAIARVHAATGKGGKDGGRNPYKGRILGTLLGTFIPVGGNLLGFLLGWRADNKAKEAAKTDGEKGETTNVVRDIVAVENELVKITFAIGNYIAKSGA